MIRRKLTNFLVWVYHSPEAMSSIFHIWHTVPVFVMALLTALFFYFGYNYTALVFSFFCAISLYKSAKFYYQWNRGGRQQFGMVLSEFTGKVNFSKYISPEEQKQQEETSKNDDRQQSSTDGRE